MNRKKTEGEPKYYLPSKIHEIKELKQTKTFDKENIF